MNHDQGITETVRNPNGGKGLPTGGIAFVGDVR